MGNVVINVKARYTDDASVKNVVKYIVGKGKNRDEQNVEYIGVRGLSRDYKMATKEIIKTQEVLKKAKGRRVYHLVVSFPCECKNLQMIKEAAKEVSNIIFREHQVIYAIHTSTDNYHIHFVINSVNYHTGKKWHKNKTEFTAYIKEMKMIVDRIVEKYYGIGLTG